jgi:S-adenosyl methyltransferase
MTSQPTPAGIYDYFLGGTHYTIADREAAEQAYAAAPEVRTAIIGNRQFVQRAIRHLALHGLRQFIDLGSGYPTAGAVHEVAAEATLRPHVLYVDYDPSVVELTRRLVSAPGIAAASYDLRKPEQIIQSPEAREVIDWSRPVVVLMAAVLHFVSDAQGPTDIVRAFRDCMAPGSYLVLSHGSFGENEDAVRYGQRAWSSATSQMHIRTRAEIEALFDGFELIPPGLTTAQEWGTSEPAPAGQGVVLAGVGRLCG